MKRTQIFKQSFVLTNDFNNDACVKAIKNQISDLAFKELINGEKHSLEMDFIIYVNEEETHELSQDMLKTLTVIDRIKNMTREEVEGIDKFDLLSLWFAATRIDTSILKKHPVNL